jgi:hypothetical protein
MKYRSLIIIATFLLSWQHAFTQDQHCATSEKMQAQLAADPGLELRRAEIEAFTQRYLAEHQSETPDREILTIPVVVHVVYSSSSMNLSDDQIISQINILNEDYRGQNVDISGVPTIWSNRVADCEIEFALATCDPNGYWTSGITRTETSVTNWNGSDDVKVTSAGGHDPWPASDYLNIWVCNIGSSLLGYAYQPGINPLLDGVVIGYRYFGLDSQAGNYDLGRTATHEIGHYLNLDHLWGPFGDNLNCTADDAVSDTPKQMEPNFGCSATYPHESCGGGSNSDMFNNYMDYGNDECLFFFTNGQKDRMRAALNGPRQSLQTSDALNQCPVGIEEQLPEASIIVYPNPTNGTTSIQCDRWDNLQCEIRIIDLSGRVVFSQTDMLLGHAAVQLDLNELSKGTYVLEVSTDKGTTSKKINIID